MANSKPLLQIRCPNPIVTSTKSLIIVAAQTQGALFFIYVP